MNGALGHVVGYMWRGGGDPHSAKLELRSPFCVFVELVNVNLVGRSFFYLYFHSRCFALARRLVTYAHAHKLAARRAQATRAAVPAAVRHC